MSERAIVGLEFGGSASEPAEFGNCPGPGNVIGTAAAPPIDAIGEPGVFGSGPCGGAIGIGLFKPGTGGAGGMFGGGPGG